MSAFIGTNPIDEPITSIDRNPTRTQKIRKVLCLHLHGSVGPLAILYSSRFRRTTNFRMADNPGVIAGWLESKGPTFPAEHGHLLVCSCHATP
jgi:hypothetical protein